MAKIAWIKSMSVGNKVLDEQHKSIINYFNDLDKMLSTKKSIDLAPVRKTTDFTYRYIKNHFAYEESCMKKVKMPGFKEHVKIHRTLIHLFGVFTKEFHNLYDKKYLSSIELAKLLTKFERDVVKKYVFYMVKEIAHLKKYKGKLTSCP